MQANEAGEMVPVTITGLGDDAVCMQCHQGRASTIHVDAAIEKVAVADEDTVSPDLSFVNIHYYAAAATRYGTMVKGGYEYKAIPMMPFLAMLRTSPNAMTAMTPIRLN